MRWRDMRGSGNIEDREGAGPPRGFGGAGFKLGGFGLVAVVAISLLLGLNPLDVIVSMQDGGNILALHFRCAVHSSGSGPTYAKLTRFHPVMSPSQPPRHAVLFDERHTGSR